MAHSVFNITGSILFLFLIPLLTRFVTWISPKGNEVDVISRQIANAHTTFNVVCTLILAAADSGDGQNRDLSGTWK